MQRDQRDKVRQSLIELRRRVTGEVEHVVEAIRQDANPAGRLSNAPVHLADAAGEGVVADAQVLANEHGILAEVDAALVRINEGTYGTCQRCDAKISEERLRAIPYAPLCITCARQ